MVRFARTAFAVWSSAASHAAASVDHSREQSSVRRPHSHSYTRFSLRSTSLEIACPLRHEALRLLAAALRPFCPLSQSTNSAGSHDRRS